MLSRLSHVYGVLPDWVHESILLLVFIASGLIIGGYCGFMALVLLRMVG